MSDETDKITGRTRTQGKLRASEIRYQRLFETARDGILILGAATRKITDVNPFMVELLGYARAEFLGKELWEIGLLKDKEASQVAFQELQENGHIRYEDLPLETKKGKRREVEFISNIYEEDGQQVIQCNIRDVTARKQAEKERSDLLAREQAARAEAEAANRAKDEFLAIVSHELRTPLTAILGMTSLLRMGRWDDSAGALEIIERNAKAQAQLIEDLLDISRIVTGKFYLEVKPVRLAHIINAAIDAVNPAADAKNIQIHTHLDKDAGLISGDPNRLQQVLWNLLSNAIKFTPEGGRIQIRLERVGEPPGSHAQVTVSDTGKVSARTFFPLYSTASVRPIARLRGVTEGLG